jgi:predicted dienelactone hydrolase
VSRWLRRLVCVVLVLGLLGAVTVAAYAAWGAAVRHRRLMLPAPAGPYPVGRTTVDLTDTARVDPLAPTAGMPRRLSVWLWYPAARVDGRRPVAYRPGAWARARDDGFWGHFVQDPRRVLDHAVADPPSAAGPLRMLVMEPGLGLAAPDYAAVAEDLASRGYVVLAVTPTFSANATVFGGQVISATPAGKDYGDALVAVWAQDARFALDRITVEGRFSGVVDTTRVGFFGHSFGGAAAVELCRTDSRCVATADVDGQPFGPVVHTGLQRPLLMLGSADLCHRARCADMPGLADLSSASTVPAIGYAVDGAQHFNFTDLALYHVTPPLRRLFPVGGIDPASALRIETDLLDAFFANAFGTGPSLAEVTARHRQIRPVSLG